MLKGSKFILTGFLIILIISCDTDAIKPVDQYKTSGSQRSGLYRTLDVIYKDLNQLKANNPNFVELYEIGRSAKGNYPIPMVRFHFSDAKVVKRYLVVAGTHGDEAAAVEAVLFTMENLVSDSSIKNLRNEPLVVDIVPLHNPDGYAENERENGLHIDLNRNFPVGYVETSMQAETKAIVELVNKMEYSASLFFHSANEEKYENLIRVPVELGARGADALNPEALSELKRLVRIVENAGNRGKPAISWRSTSHMVDVSGIASDWCVSGFINQNSSDIVQSLCTHSHPSLTIELCYPKQPMMPDKLRAEESEAFSIINAVIKKY